jgi:hypothetical protein
MADGGEVMTAAASLGDRDLVSLPWASVALPDRLGAMVEAMVISDRWATHRRGAPDLEDGDWRGALLAAGDFCARGQGNVPALWRPLLPGLVSPAAVTLVTLPHLWQQADAYGHHRPAMEGWVAELDLSPAAAATCLELFQLFCTGMAEARRGGAQQQLVVAGGEADHDWGEGLSAAIALVAQSQAQWATALGVAERRGWSWPSLALVGLLVGWAGGRASLGTALRQRWLIEPQPVTTDPWQGLTAAELDRFTADLYGRWAGLGLVQAVT